MQVHVVEGITVQEDEPDEESVSPMVSDEDADEDDDISSAQDAHEAEEHASSGGEGDLADQAHPPEAAGRLQQATSRQAELQVWHLCVWAWLFRPNRTQRTMTLTVLKPIRGACQYCQSRPTILRQPGGYSRPHTDRQSCRYGISRPTVPSALTPMKTIRGSSFMIFCLSSAMCMCEVSPCTSGS